MKKEVMKTWKLVQDAEDVQIISARIAAGNSAGLIWNFDTLDRTED